MTHEKMTDEELAAARSKLEDSWLGDTARLVLAGLDALAAERDALQEEVDEESSQRETYRAQLERVEVERDEANVAWTRDAAEVISLREQVRALEAERDTSAAREMEVHASWDRTTTALRAIERVAEETKAALQRVERERDEWRNKAELNQEDLVSAWRDRDEYREQLTNAVASAVVIEDARLRAETDAWRLRTQREEDAETVRKAIDARMAAEADNAALLRVVDVAGQALSDNAPGVAETLCGDTLLREHPGAAQLAELEALRKVREAVKSYPLDPTVTDLHYAGPELADLRRACVAADALTRTP